MMTISTNIFNMVPIVYLRILDIHTYLKKQTKLDDNNIDNVNY